MLTLPSQTVRLRRSDPPFRPRVSVETQRPSVTTVRPAAVATPPPASNTPVALPPPSAKVNVAEHPLAQHALMTLRNRHTTPAEFRQASNQLLLLLALEATRTLPTRDDLIETFSTTHTGRVLAKPVVFLAINGHGLGLAHDMTNLLPDLLVGTVSLNRAAESPGDAARLHLVNAPALSDARVILFDPVVATARSASQAVSLIRRSGATDVTLLSYLVSFQGLSRLQSATPELKVWTAAIDSDWDSKRGPMPGLGNFAERFYG